MSVRFDASGESYNRTVTLGSQANYSFACWARIAVDRNTFSTAWSFDDNMDGSAFTLCTDEDGTTMKVYDDNPGGFVATGPNMTVGTWYYLCVVVSGTSGTLYWRAATANTLSTATWTSAARTITRFLIGDDRYAEWLNGNVAAFKFWTGDLSAAEAAAESWQYTPQRLANLRAWCPFLTPETTDYSGNANTLSGGTGTTREDGPPIAWRGSSPRIILPAPAGGTTANAEAASGTGTANSATARVSTTAQTATGTGAASTPQAKVAPTTATATGTGAALNATAVTGTIATAQAATGTGSANNPTATIQTSATTATATGAAHDGQPKVAPSTTTATATGAAHDGQPKVAPSTTTATATGSANTPSSAVSPTAQAASGTGTGNNATVNTTGGTDAFAQTATATATAPDPNTKVTTNASTATGVGAAHNGLTLVSVIAQAGVATGTGSAPDLSPRILVGAGIASGSGAAHAATAVGPTVKATSTTTITAPNTSTAAVTAPNTSTSAVSTTASSTSTVT